MDAQTPEAKTQATPAEAPKLSQLREVSKQARPPTRVPAIIVGVVIAVIAGLSIWYLVRPVPLLVQGEVDATRLDIAARVDGRVAEIPGVRGQNVAALAALTALYVLLARSFRIPRPLSELVMRATAIRGMI